MSQIIRLSGVSNLFKRFYEIENIFLEYKNNQQYANIFLTNDSELVRISNDMCKITNVMNEDFYEIEDYIIQYSNLQTITSTLI